MAKSLYVGNLEWNTTDNELEELFVPFGTVISAQIIKDHSTGKSKGFGFVKLEGEESAEKALLELQGVELRGRTLKISGAREKH